MGAIYRGNNDVIAITPTAAIDAGTVVSIGDGLIGVATSDIAKDTTGWVNTKGEYDVDITAGTQYSVGALVPCAAKTLAGSDATVYFGPALKAVTSTDTVARCRLICDKRKLTDSTGGTAAAALVAPASTSYTAAELEANFATIAKYLNM